MHRGVFYSVNNISTRYQNSYSYSTVYELLLYLERTVVKIAHKSSK